MIRNTITIRRRVGGGKSRPNDASGFSIIIIVLMMLISIALTATNNASSRCIVDAFHPTAVTKRKSHQSHRMMHPDGGVNSFGSHMQAPFLSSSSKLSLSIDNDNHFNIGNDATTSDTSLQPQKYNISLLLIDHYDSFTYNLYDMLAQLTLEPPLVVTKDAFDGWNEEQWKDIDGIVLSPGPGSPQEQPAFSKQAISSNPDTPILGVCLGHQLLALEYGAKVDKAPIPIHGQDHWIRTTSTTTTTAKEDETKKNLPIQHPSIFDDLPRSFRAVRYHSLAAYEIPSEKIQVTATSADDNIIQGLQHTEYPHYGVQFHPESIGTQHGMDLLRNFCQVVEELNAVESAKERKKSNEEETNQEITQAASGGGGDHEESIHGSSSSKSTRPFRVYVHKVQQASSKDAMNGDDQSAKKSASTIMEPVEVFETFYGNQPRAIWLDSSSAASSGRGTLDIMAAPMHSKDILEHYVDAGNDKDILTQLEERLFGLDNNGTTSSKNASDPRLYVVDSDFETVRIQVDDLRDMPDPKLSNNGESAVAAADHWDHLPFEYRGGYLGFLGYEVRHETQRFLQQQDQDELLDSIASKKKRASSVPDSVFFLARQSMVYHHPTQTWYLIALVEEEQKEADVTSAVKWMEETANVLTSKNDQHKPMPKAIDTASPVQQDPLTFVPNRPKAKYKQDIADCHEFIRMGESYELCLTNQLEAEISDPSLSTWKLYQTLRLRNPAPYSAYLCWTMSGTAGAESSSSSSSQASFAICSSSPERFMSVKRTKRHPLGSISLQAEAKPIKGTCARVEPQNGICFGDAERREDERRARSLELSLKNRAENLMIVDLLRNDMSRVCQIGSVHVAKLMAIESFATVHQMVSTIRGTLSESENTLDLLRASFPGGSMTGAPKLRTLELLEELEDNVDRGPYAGSLGYLSVNGCMDMNIIIRSAVVTSNDNGGQKVSIGAGGAITALSEMEDEYEEMLLKARAVVEAVQTWAAAGSTHQISKQVAEVEESVKD